MDLRSSLVGLTPLEVVRVLLREWHGVELSAIEGTDDMGVPLVLRSLAEVAPSLSPSLRHAFARSGELNGDGSFVVLSDIGGSPWRALPGGDSPEPFRPDTPWGREVPAESFGQFVLNHVLYNLRVQAPVSAQGRFANVTSADTLHSVWLGLGSWANFCSFHATESALVQYVSGDRVLVFGRNRTEVEKVSSIGLVDWHWDRLDAIYGPELDVVLGFSWQQFPIDDSARSGELAGVFSADRFELAIETFLLSWYGLGLPDSSLPGPRLLRRLQRLNGTHRVIGAHNHLLQPDEEEDDRGVRWFFRENQAVWGAGYRGNGENPEIWWDAIDETGEQPLRFSGFRLDEFLFRQLLDEAITGAPVNAGTSFVPVDDVAQALTNFRHVGGDPNDLDGVLWTDGRILVSTAARQGFAYVSAGAHQRSDIAESPLRRLGGWRWSYET